MNRSGSKKKLGQVNLKKPVDNTDYYSLRYTPSVSVDRAATANLNTKSLKSMTRGPTPERSSALDPRELDFKSMSSDRLFRKKQSRNVREYISSAIDPEDINIIKDVNKQNQHSRDVMRTASFS